MVKHEQRGETMSFPLSLVAFATLLQLPAFAVASAAQGVKPSLSLPFAPSSSVAAAFVARASPSRGRCFKVSPGTRARPATASVRRDAAPPNSSAPGGGKDTLYGDDELRDLLSMHEELFPDDGDDSNDDADASTNVSAIPGIHDWVLQALGEEAPADTTGGGKDVSAAFLGLMEDDAPGDPTPSSKDENVDASAIPGIHDWVLQALGEEAPADTTSGGKDISSVFLGLMEDDAPGDPTPSPEDVDADVDRGEGKPSLEEILSNRRPMIRAIASDIDGTIVGGGQPPHPRTLLATSEAVRQMQQIREGGEGKIEYFIPATGKTRAGVVNSLGSLGDLIISECPGVYIQGLYCVDADGAVIFEKKLDPSAVRAAEELTIDTGIVLVGYDGDCLYTSGLERADIVTHLHEHYREPLAEVLPSLSEDHHPPGMHKLLLIDDDVDRLTIEIRPRLERLAEECGATVTQAIPTMLELLPRGCSKADGVSRLCAKLGIRPETELLAVGDAENDVGMLRMAAIGVAVGNACPAAKQAADFIMEEGCIEGGAGVAMEMFGLDEFAYDEPNGDVQ